jgi:hypothetical protein
VKTIDAETKCACGRELFCTVKKPTWHKPTVSKLSCRCGARYLMTTKIIYNGRGDRLFAHSFDAINLSEEVRKKCKGIVGKVVRQTIQVLGKSDAKII